MPIDMSLLKDFRCVLTVSKEGLVRQQQEDGSWLVVQSPERLRVLYRPSAVDRVSAEAGMLTCKVLASSAAKGSPDARKKKVLRMMFSGRAAATKANILFDTGASNNFVLKSFAKQTGIKVRPAEYSVRLVDDKKMEVAGEATAYVQLGAFYKPVKCWACQSDPSPWLLHCLKPYVSEVQLWSAPGKTSYSWQCAPAPLATAALHTASDLATEPNGHRSEKPCTTGAYRAANLRGTSLSS
jgi:hypothetical protein